MLSCTGCKRFVREADAACPFCGTPRETAFAPLALTMALGVALAACGPSVVPDADDESTSGNDTHATVEDGPGVPPNPTSPGTGPSPTSATTVDPDPSTDSTASTTSADDDVIDDEGCAFYGGCPFDVSGLQIECDLWAQDCAEGEKCMPWANDGGVH
ncbi:MAG TPA: hypothetical protein VFG69_18580 [Nannocystaceae bacterium]|nr:hypothetical protein [Nannocystaceae bacterium]